MFNKNKNIFYSLNFNAFFPELNEAIKSAVEKYWEIETKTTLQAINDFRDFRSECLIADIDFFSSQIRVENHKPVLIRFSKEYIENFLEIVLEKNVEDFKLSRLTPLEVKILNNFAEFLYKKIKEILIPVKEAKLSEKSEKYINFLFTLEPSYNSIGQMMISIPMDRLPFTPLKTAPAFKDEDFLTSNTTVKIRIGSSKIALEDLENLSSEDIIILENSNISTLTLISGSLEQKFKVKPNTDLVVQFEDDELDTQENTEQTYFEEVTMEKNLWDDIQIEVSAEFEKVKMTIGELKQITQGQVVDLGSVFNNEISLCVEDKKVASGELIIINDRYAVKLHEVLSSGVNKTAAPKPQAQPQPQAQPKPQPQPQVQQPQQAQPQPQAQEAVEDEEFDYSDFEK